MLSKNCIKSLIFSLWFCISFSQEAILCSSQSLTLKIENTLDIPIVTTNNDGTLSLNFAQQYITDIFADYIIHDFYQLYPNGSDTLQKYYMVNANSRALYESVSTQVPTSTMTIFIEYFDLSSFPIVTSISPQLITSLDGNTYDVTKYISTSDVDPCYSCPLYDVPENFNFRVNFNYDTTKDIMYMESDEPTSCGNSFAIGLKGGNPNGFENVDNTLQLWESEPGIAPQVDFSEPYHYLEFEIFSVLDIACNGYNYGNIEVSINTESETFQFYRSNAIFGYHIIEFSKVNLSTKDESFVKMKPFKSKGNPFLQISNLNDVPISVEILNGIGQTVFFTKNFEKNSIDLSSYETGLYFVRLKKLNNQQKSFKLLLN